MYDNRESVLTRQHKPTPSPRPLLSLHINRCTLYCNTFISDPGGGGDAPLNLVDKRGIHHRGARVVRLHEEARLRPQRTQAVRHLAQLDVVAELDGAREVGHNQLLVRDGCLRVFRDRLGALQQSLVREDGDDCGGDNVEEEGGAERARIGHVGERQGLGGRLPLELGPKEVDGEGHRVLYPDRHGREGRLVSLDVDGLHLGGDVEVVAQPPDVLAPRPLRQLDGLLRLAHVGADDAESAAAGRVEQIQLAERGLGNVLVVAGVVARRIARVGEEGRDAVDLEGLHVGCVQAARPEAGHVHQ
mmetsp:Transcript_16037/g.47140  ORF Transcript_16037/g.47140 Transcript_16037/m.47140 type:complete len:302 (-) Transcript_16037:847-1752(-)